MALPGPPSHRLLAVPKSGTKKEKKTFVHITGSNCSLCAVSAWLRIIQRWADLHLGPTHPLAIFSNNGTASGPPKFIWSAHINATLQYMAKAVYHITDPAAIARFTLHSVQVGACVALHAAGLQQMDIKFTLHWKLDSFYNYLRNLPCQAARAANAILNFNPNEFTLVPGRID
jgi:hypothetical protein